MLNIRNLYDLIRMKMYLWRLRLTIQGKGPKEIFSKYWQENHWNNRESRSGDGSTLVYTEHIRREIPLLLQRLGSKSILDAPCGDFNWFKEVDLGREVNYIGGDIVDVMIDELNKKYGSSNRKFIALDAIYDCLPDVDIWLCRDLIFHLPTRDIFKLVDNFIKSKIEYLLITSHVSGGIANKDTFMGGFRLINLLNPPFHFPVPDGRMRDYVDGFPERYLLLYKRETLSAWKKEKK